MFEMLRRLFQRGETPELTIEDPELGVLKWSADDEAWFGKDRDQVFALQYDGASTPSPQVRDYAMRILSDPSGLMKAVANAKAEALTTHSLFYADEIQSLTLGAIHFSVHSKRGEYAIADLKGGRDDREWRIEWSGSTCEGIGFDS